ncbi:MAG: hypothetical protein H6677_23795 [Candidatus Obscuribacterales bacterium]|nr:hypothetical protein [Candidatus Obscuribacterales bacterium]
MARSYGITDIVKIDEVTGRYHWQRMQNGNVVDSDNLSEEEAKLILEEQYNTFPAWQFVWYLRDRIRSDSVPMISLKESRKLCSEFNENMERS